jgi:predicted TIM-barrel fold metal-dependent hydrolase
MDMNDMVIISVDDHITEPSDMFRKVLSGPDLATAPVMKKAETGIDYWEYQGIKTANVAMNAVTGRPFEEYGMEPTSLDQLRPGCYDVDARIGDMDVNGIAASLNFASFVGFDGRLFVSAPDKQQSLRHLQAYNDWHIHEWCGKYPGRFIPCALLPVWDMPATVAEIKRVAAAGCTSVTISENPSRQGLPSIHNAYWEPFWKALTDNDITLCLHIGSGNPAPHASMETPIEAWITTMPMSISVGAADWLHLEALLRYPDMKICLSEGGIGWIPYFMERANFSHWRHHTWTHSHLTGMKPSDVFKRHFMNCFIDDAFGLKNLDEVGEDMVAYECDYPHSDCLWPECPEILWNSVKKLTDEQIDKVTHRNVMRFFRFDPFQHYKREELTVGALRAKAKAAGVDTTPKSSGGAAPLAAGETPRPVTSGDVMKMFADQQKAA